MWTGDVPAAQTYYVGILQTKLGSVSVKLLHFTFVIFGVSDASDSNSGSSMMKESICWAIGVSGSVSESSALGVLPFFLFWCGRDCSTAGVKVREMGAAVWPLGSAPFNDPLVFVEWITELKWYVKNLVPQKIFCISVYTCCIQNLFS